MRQACGDWREWRILKTIARLYNSKGRQKGKAKCLFSPDQTRTSSLLLSPQSRACSLLPHKESAPSEIRYPSGNARVGFLYTKLIERCNEVYPASRSEAQRSLFGPLRAGPQSWLNAHGNQSFTWRVAKLRQIGRDLCNRQLSRPLNEENRIRPNALPVSRNVYVTRKYRGSSCPDRQDLFSPHHDLSGLTTLACRAISSVANLTNATEHGI
jgi:hypothetical protein